MARRSAIAAANARSSALQPALPSRCTRSAPVSTPRVQMPTSSTASRPLVRATTPVSDACSAPGSGVPGVGDAAGRDGWCRVATAPCGSKVHTVAVRAASASAAACSSASAAASGSSHERRRTSASRASGGRTAGEEAIETMRGLSVGAAARRGRPAWVARRRTKIWAAARRTSRRTSTSASDPPAVWVG
jgi:hypothetical protein